MENLKGLKQRWFKINQPTGKHLGYPDCCIKAFCDQPPELLQRSQPTKDDMKRYRAGCISNEFTGFIPCINHAKEINAGKITLASLIKDRNSDLPPFPLAQI